MNFFMVKYSYYKRKTKDVDGNLAPFGCYRESAVGASRCK